MVSRGSSAKAGLSAVLVALALLLALQLPSSGFTGRGNPTASPSPSAGRLLVSVTLANESAIILPLQGVQVGITQFILHGLHLVVSTNGSGEAEFTLPPGTYGVSVRNSKLTLSSDVLVNAGRLTAMQVSVNRTAYAATFVEAEDSTSQGEIEPWNTVVVEIAPYLLTISGNPGSQGGLTIIGSLPGSFAPPTFNGTVFLQARTFHISNSGFVGGPEVPATIISQVVSGGGTWLTLRPSGLLELAGSTFVQVVKYTAGSSVSVENA